MLQDLKQKRVRETVGIISSLKFTDYDQRFNFVLIFNKFMELWYSIYYYYYNITRTITITIIIIIIIKYQPLFLQ